MKTLVLIIGLLASGALAFGDVLGIDVEISRGKEGQALVSLRSGLTESNRDQVSVQAAAKVLRELKFYKDAKVAVIHSKGAISSADLILLLEAMTANGIGIEIGEYSPTGTGIEMRAPGLTKAEVVSRIGFPARIELGVSAGSAPEMWFYYEDDPSGKVSEKIVDFKNGRVEGIPYPNIIPGRLLNPDRPEDLAKIAAYETRKRDLLKR